MRNILRVYSREGPVQFKLTMVPVIEVRKCLIIPALYLEYHTMNHDRRDTVYTLYR